MRRAIALVVLLACVAWTGSAEDDSDADDTTCVSDCRREDHPGCEAACSASREPSCSVSAPGLR